MSKTSILVGLVMLVSSFTPVSTNAQPNEAAAAKPGAGKPVAFCGIVIKLVETGCIGVNSSMPIAALYEITSANLKPTVGWTIAGQGTPGGVSFCMQGTHLNSVTWHKVFNGCPLTK